MTVSERVDISLTVNGAEGTASVEPRLTLADFLRVNLGLTGTHLGCEHGVCGACTVLLDGEPVRSCLIFAVQADGMNVTTVEGIAPGDGEMHPVQEGMWEATSFQCGYCAPGFVIVGAALLDENDAPTDEEIRTAISGNLCRCTGYHSIVEGIQAGARITRERRD